MRMITNVIEFNQICISRDSSKTIQISNMILKIRKKIKLIASKCKVPSKITFPLTRNVSNQIKSRRQMQLRDASG